MNILIVDDHPLVCQGMRNILLAEKNIDNVMDAQNIESALYLMGKHEFDLALVDVRLKGEDGLDFIVAAKRDYGKCRYVVLSSSSLARDFDRAMSIDVDGYILKDALPEDIVYAVNRVLRGEKYFDPIFIQMINAVPKRGQGAGETENLSPREGEILKCLAEGLSNREIADRLFISENTVKKHVSNVFTKLGLENRIQAALYFKGLSHNQ